MNIGRNCWRLIGFNFSFDSYAIESEIAIQKISSSQIIEVGVVLTPDDN